MDALKGLACSSIVDQSSSHCYIRLYVRSKYNAHLKQNINNLCKSTVNELYNIHAYGLNIVLPESKLKGHTYTYT